MRSLGFGGHADAEVFVQRHPGFPSRSWQRVAALLAGYHQLVRAGLTAQGGEEVVTRGDGAIAGFASLGGVRVRWSGCSGRWCHMGGRLEPRMRTRMGIDGGVAPRTVARL